MEFNKTVIKTQDGKNWKKIFVGNCFTRSYSIPLLQKELQ